MPGRKSNVRAPPATRGDLQFQDGAGRGTARIPHRAGEAARDLQRGGPGALPSPGAGAKARREIGCRPRDTVFLFVGSGFERKGLAAAIDALAASSNEAFWLAVVGRDRDLEKFRRRARAAGVESRTRFAGGQRDVRALYAAADCFILPTRYDPFPNTALEALAMGLPLIVSSRCGAAELVESGVNGWVCPPDDPRALANLLRAADEALRRGSMAQAARASAERFGLDAMAQQMAQLYASL